MKNARRSLQAGALCATLLLAASCGDDGDDGGDPGDVPSYRVSGTVVDFHSGEALTGSATVSTDGLSPPPTISVTGAAFTLDGVPPYSVFHLLTGSPPGYRSTYNVATEVIERDLTGVTAGALSEEYLAGLFAAFEVAPSAGNILITRAVDGGGAPVAGVPAGAFEVGGATPVAGPFFLDANLAPDPLADETSASGYAVFFQVPSGLVAVNAAEGSGYTMVMSLSPVAATAATLGVVEVTVGDAPGLPTGVSFAADVVPIFKSRGCEICHSGGGIGRDQGDLTLKGANNLIYRELTEEVSPKHMVLRVNLQSPADSLLLTMPSPASPPNGHPNVTFASPADPDYRIILGWITEGALQN
jgi:hypothetical protein